MKKPMTSLFCLIFIFVFASYTQADNYTQYFSPRFQKLDKEMDEAFEHLYKTEKPAPKPKPKPVKKAPEPEPEKTHMTDSGHWPMTEAGRLYESWGKSSKVRQERKKKAEAQSDNFLVYNWLRSWL